MSNSTEKGFKEIIKEDLKGISIMSLNKNTIMKAEWQFDDTECFLVRVFKRKKH